MKAAIYPGSFDPVTYGHLDIINRASFLTERLIIAVLKNSSKTPLFSIDERVNMLKELTGEMEGVSVQSFDGLLVDFAREQNAPVIIRGLRAVTDFEYELQISQLNKTIAPGIETVFLNTNLKYSYLSSSIVKEIASYHGDISQLVPPTVEKLIFEKFEKNRKE